MAGQGSGPGTRGGRRRREGEATEVGGVGSTLKWATEAGSPGRAARPPRGEAGRLSP